MDLLILAVVVIGVLALAHRIADQNGLSPNLIWALFVVHWLVSMVYMIGLHGDWVAYIEQGRELADKNGFEFEYLTPGTNFIRAIVHFLFLQADFSTWVLFSLFQLSGFLGLVFLASTLLPFLNMDNQTLSGLIVFLPGLHVWTCAVGKDSLIFLPLCFVLYSLVYGRYSVIFLILSVVVVFMIRPHVATGLVIAAGIAAVFSSTSYSIGFKVAALVFTGIAFAILLPFLQDFLGINFFTSENVEGRLTRMEEKTQTGNSAVELGQYSPPMRLFTYMFRPLFLEAKSLIWLAASIENSILLIGCLLLLNINIGLALIKNFHFPVIFALVFSVGMWLTLGSSTSNLGLAMRQKTMFLPTMMFLFCYLRYASKTPIDLDNYYPEEEDY